MENSVEAEQLIELVKEIVEEKTKEDNIKYNFFERYFWVGEVDDYDDTNNIATVLLPNQTTPTPYKQNKTLQTLDPGDFVLLFSPYGTLGSSFIAWAGKQYSTGTPISSGVASVNGKTGVVTLNTDDISEGATNEYFTEERAQDAVGNIFSNTSTITINYDDIGGVITADVISDSSNQKIEVEKSGSSIGTRKAINFIEGTNITLDIIEDVGNNRVNITINSSGGGGGAVDSVFSRTGAVVAQSGDYNASQVTNAFDKISDDADNIDDSSSTNKFTTQTEINKLSGIEDNAEVNPTDSEIKVAYENNANTNAFTDSEQSKLSGIESNAEVNNISDTNAGLLTGGGEITLHSHPSSGGGTTVTFFQVQDDGTTGQLTTGTATDLAGMWGTPTLTNANFSWNGTTGILTVNTDGVVEFNIKTTGWNNLNNRHELHVQLYKNSSTVIVEDAQYASRNNTQDEGSAYINGFLDQAMIGDTYRVRVFDVGVAATIGDTNVAGQTYISVKHYV